MSWQSCHLGDLVDIKGGGTPSRTIEAYWDGGIPWATVKDFKDTVLFETEETISKLGAKESATNVIPKGTIIIPTRMALGKVAIAGADVAINQDLKALVLKNTEPITTDFLFWFLRYSSEVFERAGKGATVKGITVDFLKDVQVPLPPLATQKHIARVLEQADQLRKQAQQMERELNQLAQSLFLEMFGSLGKPNHGSKRVRFGDIYRIDGKLVDPRLEKYRSLPHIGPEHIEKETGKILPYNSAEEDALISGKFLFSENEVIYSKIRPYLMKAAMPNFVGLCSADMYPLSPIDGVSTREFLWGVLMSGDFKNYLECLPGRANIPKLNRQELAAFDFYVPPFQLQQKYTIRMKAISKQKDEALNRVKALGGLFDALMQRAFNGELTERKAA